MEIQLPIILIFVFAANGLTEAVSIRAPDLTRKNPGDDCKLQWTVSGTFSNYSIVSLSTGNPRSLGSNAYSDSGDGFITLYIWNVQTQDGGFYVLTINPGSQSEQSSNAVLFVYGYIYTSIIIPSGKTQFTEGDVVELNCSVTSYSVPQAYKPNVFYVWQPAYYGILQSVSSGPALTVTGDIAVGYSLKNGGQVLVYNTSQITYYSSYYYCQAQEEGSIYQSPLSYFQAPNLQHRPFIYSLYPPSKKWNPLPNSGSNTFQFSFSSTPSLSSYSNWSFVDSSGNQQDIPLTTNLSATSYASLYVPLSGRTVQASYGNYSITLTNRFDSSSVTFQLLPPGVPDVPSDFSVRYITHSVVSLQWRCGWYNGDWQTVTVSLRNSVNGSLVETLRRPLASNAQCYNSLFTSTFRSIVAPDTDYDASIWSTNTYGRSSSVTSLAVRTPARPTLIASCDGVSFGDTSASVRLTTSAAAGAGVRLNVSCCVEATAQCTVQTMTLLTAQTQILVDPIPRGDDYVFDFLLFSSGFNYVYNLAVIKGWRVSRGASGCSASNAPPCCGSSSSTAGPSSSTAGPSSSTAGYSSSTAKPCEAAVCNDTGAADRQPQNTTSVPADRSLLIAVIVLASLLGVAVLLLVVCCILLLRRRMTTNRQIDFQQEGKRIENRAMKAESQANSYEHYEFEDFGDYMTIDDRPPPPKPPKIQTHQRF